MKKRMLLLIGFLVLMIAPVLSQEVGTWTDLYDNFPTLLLTYGGIAAIATFLGEFVIRWMALAKRFWKVAVVWVVAIGVAFLGNAINVGFLSEAVWYETLLWGCLSGALAGGIRSENVFFLKTAVEFLLNWIKLRKEPTE